MFPVLVVVPREIHSRITARTVQERETRVVKSNTRKSKLSTRFPSNKSSDIIQHPIILIDTLTINADSGIKVSMYVNLKVQFHGKMLVKPTTRYDDVDFMSSTTVKKTPLQTSIDILGISLRGLNDVQACYLFIRQACGPRYTTVPAFEAEHDFGNARGP